MAQMELHEGVYYTLEDLAAKLAREEAAAKAEKARAAAEALAESGPVDAKSVKAELAELREQHAKLVDLVESITEAFGERIGALEASQTAVPAAGEGDTPAGAGSAASGAPAKAPRARKGASA